ncbi:MAG: ATP-dependent zinc metalloprotease FtsH [Rickettsiales bacterium]|jgi:cell division protease FtsH|nr:ATP-dependent zinc metalloprotease FtsH [Rickettsiales bacterium]
MKKVVSSLFWWILLMFLLYVISNVLVSPDKDGGTKYDKIIFSEFLDRVQEGEVRAVEIKGEELTGSLKSGENFSTYAPYWMFSYDGLLKSLRASGTKIKISPRANRKHILWDVLINWLPTILWLWLIFTRLRVMNSNEGNPFSFSKSRAKLLQVKCKTTFEDVAGIDEAKDELRELVDFLRDPDKYTAIGARIPRGCLMVGPPGTGKTLLAKAIAGEANVPFYFISGSDFVEMFVGVGASRVRDMFTEAKKNAPCLVFIDEIDAVGRHRGVSFGGGCDEREQTLNQLLVELDGFEGNEGIIVIAATNREDVLDSALLRPGRFDRQITVRLPDVNGREEILKVHAKKVKMAPNVDLRSVAKSTPGFSGADLANIINEAGLLAARINKKVITDDEIEEAKERVLMGVKNQSKVKKEEEIKLIAYHEAGHAIVAVNCRNSDPIYKATIISRGRAGGYVSMPSEDDGRLTATTKARMIDDITIAMGGRAAEEIVFGADSVTAGAASDIRGATHMAKEMVVRFGMSNSIGPVYMARKLDRDNNYSLEASSDETLRTIDQEIKSIIMGCKKAAEEIIVKNRENLVIIAEALLKYETLTGQEIRDLIEGKVIRKDIANGENILVDSVSLLVKVMEGNKNENTSGEEG